MKKQDPTRPDVLRWTAGCFVAAAATVGILILVFLVAIALQPPVWVQVLLGVGLAAGGAILAWLIASGLAQGQSRERPPVRAVSPPPDDGEDEVVGDGSG